MARVHNNRRTERAGVNETRLLLENHGHVVDEVSGGSDFGEDLLVWPVAGNARTGVSIAIQVKSGTSFRRAGGYRVSVGSHAREWREANVPVACVVFDPEMRLLYWANATGQLRADTGAKSIYISDSSVLGNGSVHSMLDEMTRGASTAGRAHKRSTSIRPSRTVVDPEAPVGGHPNREFDAIAAWAEMNRRLLSRIAHGLMIVVLLCSLVLMSGPVWDFAQNYAPTMPWLWATMVFAFTVLGFWAILAEARAGRRPWYLRWLVFAPLVVGWGLGFAEGFLEIVPPDPWPQLAATMIAQYIKLALLFGTAYFVSRELNRRRRVRAAAAASAPKETSMADSPRSMD